MSSEQPSVITPCPERGSQLKPCHVELLARRLELLPQVRAVLEDVSAPVELVSDLPVEEFQNRSQHACRLCAVAVGEASETEFERAMERANNKHAFEIAVLAFRAFPGVVVTLAHHFIVSAIRASRLAPVA